jgi:outer membrane protein assembly factor BamA
LRRTLVAIALILLDLYGSAHPLSQSRHTARKDVSVDVVLHSPIALTPNERRQLTGKVRKFGWDQSEEIVRELFQDKGFLKADVVTIRTPNNKERALVLQVTPGKRYHLVRLSWRGNTVFSEFELANRIPFRPGELSNRTKIDKGLNAIRELYDSRGYINYICVPTPETDDEAATVAFVMDVDEGRQFSFGKLECGRDGGNAPRNTAICVGRLAWAS